MAIQENRQTTPRTRNLAAAGTVLLLFLSLLLASEWLRSGSANGSKLPPITKIRVGYIPIAECAHLYVGIDKGFFQQEGIEIVLQPMKGGATILPAVQNKDLDIGFANVVSLLALNSRYSSRDPEQLVSIMGATYERPNHCNHALIIPRDSHLTTADLIKPETKIALNTTRNIEELMILRYLRERRQPDAPLTIVPIAFPEMLSALEHGAVHVASVVEPFIEPALRSGRFRLLDRQYLAVSRNTLVATYATTRRWRESHQDLAAALLRAFHKADEFIKTNDGEVRHIIGSFTNIQKEDLTIIGLPAFERSIERAPLQELLDSMLQYKFITVSPAIDDIILP